MSSKQHNNMDSEEVLWLIASFIVIGGLVFWMWKAPIYYFMLELSKKFLTLIYFAKYSIGFDTVNTTTSLILLTDGELASSPSYSNLWKIMDIVGRRFNYLFVGMIIIWLIVVNVFYRYENFFRRTLNFASHKKDMIKINPKLSPIAHIKNYATNEEKGPFSRSETPWEFAVKYNIIKGHLSSTAETKATFNEKRALKVFQNQMGEIMPHPLVQDGVPQIDGSSRIMLGILCAFYEREYSLFKELTYDSARWFKATPIIKNIPFYKRWLAKIKVILDIQGWHAGPFKYEMNVPQHRSEQLDRLIVQAFTNSCTIDKHEHTRRMEKNEPLIHKDIRKAIHIHDFTFTILMKMWAGIPLISANDYIWLKGINRPLFYALNVVGRPSPLTRSMGTFHLYVTEFNSFKTNSKLFKKELDKPHGYKKDFILKSTDMEPMLDDLHFILEHGQWVHHERYKDVEDEAIINLEEREFSYDNELIIVTHSVYDRDAGKVKCEYLQFLTMDNEEFISIMVLNDAEKLDDIDINNFNAIINSYYIYTTDINVLSHICYINSVSKNKLILRGYNYLQDFRELTNVDHRSFYSFMKKHKANWPELEKNYSDQDIARDLINKLSPELRERFVEQQVDNDSQKEVEDE